MKNNLFPRGVLAAVLVSGAAAASAAGVDVTATVASITDQLAPIGLIGIAVLGVFVALKGFVWVRRALA